ncbi:MAG: aspartate/glutamate racemase family protein [Coriobacteriales bacterium]|nr:aspartate/glutamate racemase family protein [Coriobacteriales bacterium]
MALKPAIGVIGGLGPQASALLYQLLVDRARYHTDLRDTADYPRIVLVSTSIPNYLSTGEATDPAIMAQVIGLVQEEVRVLEQAGSIVIGIACNTAHLALDALQAVTSVPFLSIMDLMQDAARPFKRPGLLSTRLTKQTGLYDTVHPALFVPDDSVLEQAETWVFKLLDGSLTPEDAEEFHRFVEDYQKTNELDAVLLACTELPVVYGPANRPSIVSTLDVLADGLLSYYYRHV